MNPRINRRMFFAALLGLGGASAVAQSTSDTQSLRTPSVMLRVGMLLLPTPTPLVSLEVRVWGRLSVQLESNFSTIHGATAKWYLRRPMDGPYVLAACAIVKDNRLEPTGAFTPLPYVGYGSVWGIGNSKNWVVEARGGLGVAIRPSGGVFPLPVAKATIGYRF